VSANHGTRRTEDEWTCNVCGERFVSLEGYKEKLRKESTWAKAWIEWSQEHAAPSEPTPVLEPGLTTEAN
jgi:predicted methyltransferase